uniref:HDC06498 n=1 Tax=Drosophila melanogaster TaxID=7227 RepID=Q6IGE7_DROME|nr:TPA_inf: HDC06498 [Drosophila melanogaster]
MKDEQQAERPNRFSISFMGFQTNQSASHPAIQPSVVLASGVDDGDGDDDDDVDVDMRVSRSTSPTDLPMCLRLSLCQSRFLAAS